MIRKIKSNKQKARFTTKLIVEFTVKIIVRVLLPELTG